MIMNEVTELARFLFANQIKCHVDTKDKGFYNGLILELHETFLVINDRMIGKMPIAFSEIDVIERFRGKEK